MILMDGASFAKHIGRYNKTTFLQSRGLRQVLVIGDLYLVYTFITAGGTSINQATDEVHSPSKTELI